MSELAIEVRKLSKSYMISHRLRRNTHPTIKDELARLARKPLELLGAAGGVSKEKFWALKDINLEVKPGEVVGIMGKNGSGKSTLFQILSRVSSPTKGEATIRGRMTSLLEVGTGFHPELTGRENVYFNGAVLGMTKVQIDERFQRIVDFAEVEKFIDTPVKFYSSGMKVRLAFAVAAHLEPEVLLIDEVLAVGDANFKAKSLDHMKKIANSGTTILFVSHIVSQIEKICNRGVVLDDGKKVFDGDLPKAIDKYLDLNKLDASGRASAISEDGAAKAKPTITSDELSISLETPVVSAGKHAPSLKFVLAVDNKAAKNFDNLRIALTVLDSQNRNISMINTRLAGADVAVAPGSKTTRFEILVPEANIAPGTYKLTYELASLDKEIGVYHRVDGAMPLVIPGFKLKNVDVSGPRRLPLPPVVLDYEVKRLD